MIEDFVIRVLFGLAIAVVIGLVLAGVFFLADSSFLPVHNAPGVIDSVRFEPEHTEWVYNAALKMSMPETIPARYWIKVSVPAGSDEAAFDSLQEWDRQGASVSASYKLGRFSHSVYLTGIAPLR